jgi:zinc protease
MNMKKHLVVFSSVTLLAVAGLVAQTVDLQQSIPFDAVVRTATLPSGLKYFIRQNSRPAKRLSLRLAVKAGSLFEADDQQGLAHLIEHMAFNGSAHFKPGELVSYFESIGARLGPHVNAYTSFDETVYMLDVPSDNQEVVQKAVTALADFAGGLSLTKEEIDKERGVVIEEWRGGLGAGSRIRDKQLPILFYQSRYAERLPIGKPDIIRNAPAERLRAFYDTWYRPDRIAVVAVGDVEPSQIEQTIKAAFSPLTARAAAAQPPDRKVPLHQQPLVSIVADPEVTRSTVEIVRKRAREGEQKVGDYRRDLVARIIDHIMDERFSDLERKPDAKFLSAGAGNSALSRDVATFDMEARVQDGKLEDGAAVLTTEANRVREFGFGTAEIERAKAWMKAFYEHAYTDREKTESGSFAQEYVSYFLNDEPSPGIEYEYKLVQQLLPTITDADTSNLARALLKDDSRVILATMPQKSGVKVPSEAELQAAIAAASATRVTPWTETATSRALMENPPSGGSVASKRTLEDIGVTIVRFANGVEAWLKPTDFKNDQILFTLNAMGGASLASPQDFLDASMATSLVSESGVGGLKATDLQKVLTGKLVVARPFIALSSHGVSGSAPPAQLETALQLLYQDLTAPGNDPEAFALMKKQLDAAVANRGREPRQIFGEKLSQVNTSNHYTAQPLTPERVASLDREKMIAFYRARFANAADFTFFMVGAFKVDETIPLLAEYVGALPSTGQKTSTYKDVGLHFPAANEKATVVAGQEPRGQSVVSFFADPSIDPQEQEYVIAANTVLDIALRDILREELGQTYTVSVGLSQPLPQKGAGHIQIRFGADPKNLDTMIDRSLQEIARLQKEGPSVDLTNRAKESARRGYETALRDNGYWLGRLQTVQTYNRDPGEILTRPKRIDAVTPQVLQETFKKYFPSERMTVVTLVPVETK